MPGKREKLDGAKKKINKVIEVALRRSGQNFLEHLPLVFRRA